MTASRDCNARLPAQINMCISPVFWAASEIIIWGKMWVVVLLEGARVPAAVSSVDRVAQGRRAAVVICGLIAGRLRDPAWHAVLRVWGKGHGGSGAQARGA